MNHFPSAKAHILGVETSVPPYELDQEVIAAHVRRIFIERFPSFDRVANVFASAGIKKRHSVRPLKWQAAQNGWIERNEAYLEGAQAMFLEATEKVLASTGLKASDIDTVVTISSSGIATPSLDARLFSKLGFRRDIHRVPVFGLGCAGGVTGLAIARRLAEGSPGSRVLVVAVECSTLSSRLDEMTKGNFIALALFGDGCAATILSTDAGGCKPIGTITGSSERIWPDTLDIMGWKVEPTGFGVILDQSVPAFVAANLRENIESMLAEQSLTVADITRFICHPGGRKVVESIEQAMDLPPDTLQVEREVLRDYGNMSSPTVMFVLNRVMAERPAGRFMATALGPGFTLTSVTFESAA